MVVAAADEHGRLLALDASPVNVMVGYLRTHGVWAASLTASYLPGPYRSAPQSPRRVCE
jgi:hypothetical protein